MAGVSASTSSRVRRDVPGTRTSGVTSRTPTAPETKPTTKTTTTKPTTKPTRDSFEPDRSRRSTTPATPTTTRPVKSGGDDDDVLVIKTAAPTPEHALADELFAVSNDERLVSRVRERATRPGKPIDGRTSPRMRQAYQEFIQSRGLSDSEANQREFTQLLDARRAYASRNGLGAMNANDERRFLAEAALSRLSVRAKAGQSLELRDGDRWMISALSDPKVSLSPADQKLLEKCEWRDQGLRTTMPEARAKAQAMEAQREAEFRSTPGRPYKTVLNADDVFQGDVQANAFTLAAKAGGYSAEETRLAMEQLKLNGTPLFCNRNLEGEPLILEKQQVTGMFKRGGQEFFAYAMSSEGSLALRDARSALAEGYGSVKDYRDAFNNTLATRFANLGAEWVKNEQTADTALGKSQHPILGPLMRGKYDAMRELVQLGTNGLQMGEMFTTTAKLAYEKGDLLANIKNDPESVRYFDEETARFGATFDALSKTYAEKEDTIAGQVARGFVASIPKALVSTIPGAALGYTALKDFHSPPNELMKDLTIDLLSIVTGPLLGGAAQSLEGTVSRVAPKLVDSTLKQFVVQEVMDRGISSVAGATQEVATAMGPALMQQYLGKDGKPLSEADQRKVSEQLTDAAFRRAVWTGALTGLLMPSRPSRDMDTAVVNQKGATIEGPIYKTMSADQESRLYAAVVVPEAKGKKRVEFVEVSPDNPRVQQALKQQPAKLTSQVDADTALAISRYQYRLNDAGRKELAVKANNFAAAKVRLDAETARLRNTETTTPTTQTTKPTTTTKPQEPTTTTKPLEPSKKVALRETKEGVVLDGAKVPIADRTLEYPELRFTPSELGPVGRFTEYLKEKGIKTSGSAQIAEGNSRIVLEHPAFPDKVIKIYSKGKIPDYNTQVPYLLQRELALESFLKDSGVRVATIDRDPALLSRGIVVQEKVKAQPYAEVRDTLPPAVREKLDAQIQGLKDRYNDALFKDYAARSGKPLTTREAPNKPITPAGFDLNIGNVLLDTSKPTPELVIIDW
ncbi:DUF3383 domain-containing protein [Corallococcus sicarius]|uniref:DUF3383 domain-containing protein n=1 Tax=Corallococcus sicarius TaxID=2316726 RepID=UPI0011C3AADE|nr:DUF3383 domain-containing protein [Corallococcus sicarius]